ncbi:MAG: S41 family peptidase [Bacteroidales bacterium]|nr:S41 family peptidase [Bacteroidales bacterium]
MKRLLFYCFIVCSVIISHSQELRKLSGDEIREDLWFFRILLEKGHINIQSVAQMQKIDSLIKIIDEKYRTSGAYQYEFFLELLKVVHHVNDIHTAVFLTEEDNDYIKNNGKYLPLSLSYEKGKLLIKDITHSEKDKLIRQEVISINGKDADSIMAILIKFVNIDGDDSLVQKKLAAYYFRSLYPFLFPCLDSNLIVLKNDTSQLIDTLVLLSCQKKDETSNNAKSDKSNDPNFSFFYLDEERLGYLKISSFLPSELKSYRIFLRDVFHYLKKNKTDVLILDLRNNSGGLLDFARQLLEYLIPSERRYIDYVTLRNNLVIQWVLIKNSFLQPEITRFIGRLSGKAQRHLWSKNLVSTYKNFPVKSVKPNFFVYTGKLYVLMNSLCASATGVVLNNLYMRPNTIFLGTPAACTRDGSYGNPVSFKLPNSRIRITVSSIYIKQTVDTAFFNYKSYPFKNIVPHIIVEDKEFPTNLEELYHFLLEKERNHVFFQNKQK